MAALWGLEDDPEAPAAPRVAVARSKLTGHLWSRAPTELREMPDSPVWVTALLKPPKIPPSLPRRWRQDAGVNEAEVMFTFGEYIRYFIAV